MTNTKPITQLKAKRFKDCSCVCVAQSLIGFDSTSPFIPEGRYVVSKQWRLQLLCVVGVGSCELPGT